MSEKKTKKTKETKPKEKKVKDKKKKNSSRAGVILTIALLILLIPCLVFAGILLKSYAETSSPVLGQRFEGDLDPAITDQDMDRVKAVIETMPGVEKVDIVLKTSQMRVNVDVTDSISEEEALQLTNDIYNKVNDILPVRTYFTATSTMKMYDLTINVYNKIGNDDGLMVYYLLTKNATMEGPAVQLVSKPLDEELAKELRGEGDPDTGEVSGNESDLSGDTEDGEE